MDDQPVVPSAPNPLSEARLGDGEVWGRVSAKIEKPRLSVGAFDFLGFDVTGIVIGTEFNWICSALDSRLVCSAQEDDFPGYSLPSFGGVPQLS